MIDGQNVTLKDHLAFNHPIINQDLLQKINASSASLLTYSNKLSGWYSNRINQMVLPLELAGLDFYSKELFEFIPGIKIDWQAVALTENQKGFVLLLCGMDLADSLNCDIKLQGKELKKLEKSFSEVKTYLNIDYAQPWSETNIWFASVIAYLYFMNVILELPTWLAIHYGRINDTHEVLQKILSDFGFTQSTPLTEKIILIANR